MIFSPSSPAVGTAEGCLWRGEDPLDVDDRHEGRRALAQQGRREVAAGRFSRRCRLAGNMNWCSIGPSIRSSPIGRLPDRHAETQSESSPRDSGLEHGLLGRVAANGDPRPRLGWKVTGQNRCWRRMITGRESEEGEAWGGWHAFTRPRETACSREIPGLTRRADEFRIQVLC